MIVTVFTHRSGRDTWPALDQLLGMGRRTGVTLRFPPEETERHGLQPAEGLDLDAEISGTADVCIVLGGDGTILTALRRYADTGVPVFAVNYGTVGFLATIDPEDLAMGLERAFTGEFDKMRLPSVSVSGLGESFFGFNDVSFHRKPGARVVDLAYSVGDTEIGRVRSDGLVCASPAGSTGYNLANGGPVLAWGVEGYVVSFIAPHSFTARPLVVAPTDVLTIRNCSQDDPVEMHADGRPTTSLPAGGEVQVEFARHVSDLAQLPGASFYHRLRERFGRLAT